MNKHDELTELLAFDADNLVFAEKHKIASRIRQATDLLELYGDALEKISWDFYKENFKTLDEAQKYAKSTIEGE